MPTGAAAPNRCPDMEMPRDWRLPARDGTWTFAVRMADRHRRPFLPPENATASPRGGHSVRFDFHEDPGAHVAGSRAYAAGPRRARRRADAHRLDERAGRRPRRPSRGA